MLALTDNLSSIKIPH